MKRYTVRYTGPFAFIKPWTAVRDGETFSQQFLTPSIVEGMEKKLFPEWLHHPGLQGCITGHRLNYTGISPQQEQTWSKAWIEKAGEPVIRHEEVRTKGGQMKIKEVKISTFSRKPATGILVRGVLIEPHLYLAFSSAEYAERAAAQHLCLCRNEDLMLPDLMEELDEQDWQEIPGFELVWDGEAPGAQFKVGHNRFSGASPMFGRLVSTGDPIRKAEHL